MAHYAYVNENNIVTDIIVGRDETDIVEGISSWEDYYGALRTSYNGKIRYNYAGVGFSYDPIDDAFIAPMPECGHETLLLNAQKRWECAECEAMWHEPFPI